LHIFVKGCSRGLEPAQLEPAQHEPAQLAPVMPVPAIPARTQKAICRAPENTYVVWVCRTEEPFGRKGAQYTDYNPDWTRLLEETYATGRPNMTYTPGEREEFTIDFATMTQVNNRTKTVRPVRRFVLTAQQALEMEQVETNAAAQNKANWDLWRQQQEAKKAKTEPSSPETTAKKEDVPMSDPTA
jgi:hypothetical protein